jgi:hypothetical protein
MGCGCCSGASATVAVTPRAPVPTFPNRKLAHHLPPNASQRSWSNVPRFLRSAFRNGYLPDARSSLLSSAFGCQELR